MIDTTNLLVDASYECRFFAVLLTDGPFTASIRIEADTDVEWHLHTSSGQWRTFNGEAVTPLIRLSTAAGGSLLLPSSWSAPFQYEVIPVLLRTCL